LLKPRATGGRVIASRFTRPKPGSLSEKALVMTRPVSFGDTTTLPPPGASRTTASANSFRNWTSREKTASGRGGPVCAEAGSASAPSASVAPRRASNGARRGVRSVITDLLQVPGAAGAVRGAAAP